VVSFDLGNELYCGRSKTAMRHKQYEHRPLTLKEWRAMLKVPCTSSPQEILNGMRQYGRNSIVPADAIGADASKTDQLNQVFIKNNLPYRLHVVQGCYDILRIALNDSIADPRYRELYQRLGSGRLVKLVRKVD